MAAALGVFILGSFVPALRTLRHGYPSYYVAARLVVEGRWTPNVYDNDWYIAEVRARTLNQIGEVYVPNPPVTAMLMVPLVWLDIIAARQVWLWINLALLGAVLWLLALGLPAERPAARAVLVAGALAAAPIHENFRLGQAYVALLFCFALALWRLEGGRQASAGAALGAAVAAKVSGAPVWFVLAARGHWRTLGSAAVIAAAACAVSFAYAGWAGWQRFALLLVELLGEPGTLAVTAYQTTPSYFQHLFRPDPVWNPLPLWALPAWAARGSTLAVSLVGLGLLWRRARSARLDLAFAAALTLGVVLLPFAEEYHYALLVLPFAAALGHMARDPRRATPLAIGWLAAAALLVAAPWPYKHPWLAAGWHALLAYPRLYGGWLLWAWLMRAMAEPGTEDAPGRVTT